MSQREEGAAPPEAAALRAAPQQRAAARARRSKRAPPILLHFLVVTAIFAARKPSHKQSLSNLSRPLKLWPTKMERGARCDGKGRKEGGKWYGQSKSNLNFDFDPDPDPDPDPLGRYVASIAIIS